MQFVYQIHSSKMTCDFIARGLDAQPAAEAAVQVLAERVKGRGGVIVVDASGRIGAAHNTPRMAHAFVTGGHEIIACIQCD